MKLRANCKINIGLDVLRRRADGFHDVSTVMVPVRELYDRLEIEPAIETELVQLGLPVDCPPEDNICLRAWRLMHERYGAGPVRIVLDKRVPYGAGLGGSRLSRAGCILFGWAMLVLGVVGIFVPLLPTTPFLLLAAWAFCRSSPRLYDRLLAHPCLGAYVRNFREYRAIPLRAKIISVTLNWATLLYCIFGVVRAWWWAQAGLLLLAVGLTWHILSYATLRRPE